MKSTIIGLLSLTAVSLLLGCQNSNEKVEAANLREVASPAGKGSGQSNLAVGPGGETYLSWMEKNASGTPVLKFATRAKDAWSEPRMIAQGDDLLVNWADFPSVIPLENGVLAAHWMTLVPDHEGYNVNIAFSRDGGQTWSKPVTPHRDGTPTEHGFVSLVPAPGGGIGAVWLDSRKLASKEGSDEVAMMYTNVNLDGNLGSELTIDGRVCECCQPNAAPVPGGILAVYRDRSDREIRDIAIVRFDGNRWSEPKTVFADNWEIYACPINGPAIATHESNVAVAWFTAPNDQPKVQVALSQDGGNTFGQPIQIDGGQSIGRVDVEIPDSGGAVVTWLTKSEKGAEFRARQVGRDGTLYPSFLIGATTSATSSGFPRLARSGETLIFAWTDTNENRVRTAVLDVRTGR